MTLVQDREGFLWLGTQMGLIRWDGQRLRRHAADPARADALPDNYVMSLHVAANGDVWAGTSSGGLVRYDPVRDSFLRISGLRDVRVSALADDGAGGLWVGTGAGLERVLANGAVRSAAAGAPQIAAAALANGGIEQLRRDRNGGLWIGTRKGLWFRSADQSPLNHLALPGTDRTAPAITAITEDSAGRIWIGTRVHGAYLIQPGTTPPVRVLESGTGRSLEGERVLSIVEKSRGTIWLGMEGGGIVELDVAEGKTRRIRHRPDVADLARR